MYNWRPYYYAANYYMYWYKTFTNVRKLEIYITGTYNHRDSNCRPLNRELTFTTTLPQLLYSM